MGRCLGFINNKFVYISRDRHVTLVKFHDKFVRRFLQFLQQGRASRKSSLGEYFLERVAGVRHFLNPIFEVFCSP